MGRSQVELVGAARGGDRQAFVALVESHQGALLATAAHLVSDASAAEDLAQETFLQAYRNLRALRDPTRFTAWLYAILRSQCRKHLRRARRSIPTDPARMPETPSRDPEPPDQALLDALDRLPPDAKEILSARYLGGLSYRDIAEGMGSTEGSIRVRCLRARRALREVLEAQAAPEEGVPA